MKEMIQFVIWSCLLQSLPVLYGFDRSAVEKENRYAPALSLFYQDQKPAASEDKVLYEPDQLLAHTKFGTYYGAAANPWFLNLLPQKNRPAFPMSKAEVQGKPQGISVYEARRAYQQTLLKSFQAKPYNYDGVSQGYKIVCYYEGWAVYRNYKQPSFYQEGQQDNQFTPKKIDAKMCTHLIYSFAGLQGNKIVSLDPEMDIEKGQYAEALALKATNPDLKVMIAIGGWNEGVKKYSQMASSASNRKEFVDSVVEFLELHGFDGLDVDWEYPGDTERGGGWSDKENYSLLLEELKQALAPKNWLLSAAVPAPKSRIDPGYDVPRVAQALDFINVMTYDLHGTWDGFADHHAPLYKRAHDYYPYNTLTVDFAMKYWAEKGAPKSKLIMGVPFYGRSFNLQNPANYKPGTSAKSKGGFQGPLTNEDGYLGYLEICSMVKNGWNVRKDDTGNVYAHLEEKWVGYDTVESVERKMNYVRSNGFGGGMVWAIDLDDVEGYCGERWPLLKAINRVLHSNEPVPVDEESTNEPESIDVISPVENVEFTCPGVGTFASPNDCQSYFQCAGDNLPGYPGKCPPGLNFNPDSSICDWPDNVQCQVSTKNYQPEESNECSQVQANGLFADPYNCRSMYWCIAGKKVQTACPSGLFFDPMSASCHFYAAYRCYHNEGQGQAATPYFNWPQVPMHYSLIPPSSIQSIDEPQTKFASVSSYAYKRDKNVICYFANWAQMRKDNAKFVPENVNARLCTHIFYAYANLDSVTFEAVPGDPLVDINDGYFTRLVDVAKKQNPTVKVLLSLGGWTDSGGEKYSKMANDPSKRTNFVNKVVEMLTTRQFDGLSLEWQYPVCWQSDCKNGNQKDKQNFALLVQQLKQKFQAENLILAAGLTGYVGLAKQAYLAQDIAQNLDMAVIYGYDYHGYWDGQTDHHSSLKDVKTVMNYYMQNGFKRDQLVLGVPLYGQTYTLKSSGQDQVGSASVGPGNPGPFTLQQGMMAYFEICQKIKNDNWQSSFVAYQGTIATKGNQWASYNCMSFVAQKAEYVMEENLGGVAIFTMDMDDFNNECCQGAYPLLNTLASKLIQKGDAPRNGDCAKPAPVTTPAPPETSTGYDDGGRFPTTSSSSAWSPASTTTTTTTTRRPEIEAVEAEDNEGGMQAGNKCPGNGDTFSHRDCQKYYRCVNGKLVEQQCTVGLLWNNQLGRCDWANLIICGTRNVPLDLLDTVAQKTTTEQPTSTVGNLDAVPCPPGSYRAVPGECGAYVSCNTNGVAQKSYCSQGLHWNQDTLSCTWARDSTCQDGAPQAYLNFYQEGSPCSQQGSFAPNPKDCSSYLLCNHDAYLVQPCPAGLHWDNKISACNTPKEAQCQPGVGQPVDNTVDNQGPSTTTTTTQSTTQWQWTPENDNNDGSYNPGQWEWKPPTTTTTETTFIETSDVKEPLSGDFKVVCYFTNWAWYRPGLGKYRPEDIDPTICTHVVYGFAVLDGSNLVIKPHDTWADLDNDFYKKVTALKRYGIKVTIAIGGWNDSLGSKYSNLVNNPAARSKFVKHVVEFIEKYDFDGLDLDWEYPKCWQVDCEKGPDSDKESFALWVKELKEAFRPKGLLLSAAVSPSKKVMDLGYDIPSIARDLDWIAVMTYDYHGHWDKKTGHVAPMYAHPEDDYDYFNTDFTIRYWMENGAPADKLVMGMPLYGQAFTLNSEQNNGLNAPANQKGQAGEFTRAAGFLAYYEICDMIKNKGFNVVTDSKGRLGPYAHKGNQWVGYDDISMIRYKSNYIRKMGLAGGMVWALDLDDFKNRCGQGHHPLMNTIKEVLGPKMTSEEQAARVKSAPVENESQELDIRNGLSPGLTVTPKIGSGSKKVVCYFTNWAFYRPGSGKFLPKDIDVSLCTHIVYGFAVLNPRTLTIRAHDSWVDFDKEFYKQVTELKGADRKVSLALGGWNDSKGDKYSRLVNDPQARAKFIQETIPFLKKHNFDGLDLDWEYPKCWQVDCKKGPASDKESFALWVQELSQALHAEGMILSSAMSPSAKVCDEAYDIPSLNNHFDFVSIMTYDYHGQWDKKTGHVAPIYPHPDDFDLTFNVNYTLHYWLDKGMDKEKIIMGLPLYGQSFTLASSKANGLNSKSYGGANAGKFTRSRGFLSYYEICDKVKNKGWQVVRDAEGRMGPYAFKGTQWVSFDDIDTIEQKMDLLKDLDLGGAMIWALDLDDFNNQCGNGNYPLLKTINHNLGRISGYQRPDLLVTNDNYIRTSSDEDEDEDYEELIDEDTDEQLQSHIRDVPYNMPYFYQSLPVFPYAQQPLLTYDPKK